MRPRLAVVGGGMGGVSTAYFCDPGWSVDLFEAQSHVGGNATTIAVPHDGQDVLVDIGAESFNSRTHPLYWSLLQALGAIGQASDDILIEMPGTLSIFDATTRSPLFVSTHPLRTPRRSLDLYRFVRAARAFMADEPSGDTPVGEWFDGLRIDRDFAKDALLPWLASLTCFRVETVRTQSLLAFLLLFLDVFPDRMLDRPKTYCSRIGLGGILSLLVARCENLTVRTDAPVSRVERVGRSWFVEAAGGRHGPYEKVVVNAPPYAAREFLTGSPDGLRDVLGEYEYYPTRMTIHTDPIYMPADRGDWCTHNAAVAGDTCEATIWLGGFRKSPVTGKPIDLFKSWDSERPAPAHGVLAERTFKHSLLSPATLRAAGELSRWQGVDGLHFAGSCTTQTDLQETALSSGMAAASAIMPDSPRLLDRLGG